MWTDPEWFIYQLDVWIWFCSSAAWSPTFLFLTVSTLYSSSYGEHHLNEINPPLPSLLSPPPSNGLEMNKPSKGLSGGFPQNCRLNYKPLFGKMSLHSSPQRSFLRGGSTREMAEIEPNRAANLNSTLSETLNTVRTYAESSFFHGCLPCSSISQQKVSLKG